MEKNFKCRLFDKVANEWIDYKDATHTKLDGIYGYICVDVMSVKFFWYCEYSQRICVDDISNRFNVEYVIN